MERRGGAKRVDDFVALTPLWRGTELGGAAMLRDLGAGFGVSRAADRPGLELCASCPQFLAGSDYLNDLNADGEAIPASTTPTSRPATTSS